MSDEEAGEEGRRDSARSGLLRSLLNRLTGKESSLARLRAEIEPLRTDIEIRKGSGDGTSPWIGGAERQIAVAERAAAAGDAEVGWRSLLQARRLLVHSFDGETEEGREELLARATAVRTEAEEKLDGWRLDAVRELLPERRETGTETAVPTPGAIYSAAEILDARHGNVHRRVALVRKQVLVLALVEFVGVFGLLAVATYWQSPFEAAAGSPTLLVAVALFGLMGASAGRLVALAGASRPETLPVLAINWWMTLGRTLMGAAAALALYAFLHSGLVAVGGVDVASRAFQALVLAVAFAAGFSERLLERAVAAVGGTEGSEPTGNGPRETGSATDRES